MIDVKLKKIKQNQFAKVLLMDLLLIRINDDGGQNRFVLEKKRALLI